MTKPEFQGREAGFVIAATNATTVKIVSMLVGNVADATISVTNKSGLAMQLPDSAVTRVQGFDDSSQKAVAKMTNTGVIATTNAFGEPSPLDHEYGTASFIYTAMDGANPDVIGESLLTVYFSLPTPVLVVTNALLSDGVYRLNGTEDANITLTIQKDLGLFGSLIFRGLTDAAHTGISYVDTSGISHTIALTRTLDAAKGSGLWSTSDAAALRADTFHIDLPEHASGVFDFEIEGLAKYGSVRSNIVRKVVIDVAPVVSGLGCDRANSSDCRTLPHR